MLLKPITLLLFLSLTCHVFAQEKVLDTLNTNTLYDVLNDKSLVYTENGYNVSSQYGRTVYKQYKLESPVILSPSSSNINHIIKRIKEILVEQVKTDSFQLKLKNNLKETLITYMNVYSDNLEDTSEVFSKDINPNIQEIIYRLSLSCSSILTMVAIFKYDFNIPVYGRIYDYNSEGITFKNNYFETYYFDLSNGKEYRPKDIFKPSSEKEINKVINDLVSLDMDTVTRVINKTNFDKFYDEDPDFDENLQKINNTLNTKDKHLIDFSVNKDGFVYPKPYSLEYYIPAWQPCTKNIYGLGRPIRLTCEQVKKFINPNGPFASLINQPATASTSIQNQNNSKALLVYNLHTDLDGNYIDQVIPLKIDDNVKKVKLLLDDNPFVEALYTADGFIDSITGYSYGSEQAFGERKYIYDERNNVISLTFWKSETNDPQTWDFRYDSMNNLIYQKIGGTKYYHKYYDNYWLQERYDYADEFYGIEGYSGGVEGNPFNNSVLKYILNEPEKKFNYSEAYISSDICQVVQYEYGENNNEVILKIMSINWNQVSYSSVYQFDDTGNLISWGYDGDTIKYEYNKEGNLTLKTQKRRGYTSFNNLREIEYNKEGHPRFVRIYRENGQKPLEYAINYEYWE